MPYAGPMGGAVSFERGTPVAHGSTVGGFGVTIQDSSGVRMQEAGCGEVPVRGTGRAPSHNLYGLLGDHDLYGL